MKLQIEQAPRRLIDFSLGFKDKTTDVILSGSYKKDGSALVVNANLSGKITVTCGVSCKEFSKEIDEDLNVKFVCGEYRGFDPVFDIIETDGIADIDEFLRSEIESFRLDYHIAPNEEFLEANL